MLDQSVPFEEPNRTVLTTSVGWFCDQGRCLVRMNIADDQAGRLRSAK